MRNRVWIGVLAATAAAGLLLRADEPKPPPKPTGDFAGRVVVVQSKGGVKNATLENAGVRPLGGRQFLVGKAINDDTLNQRSYFTGAEVWVPVADIESLVVFETLGQLKRAAGQ
jgi:hypothetical protein